MMQPSFVWAACHYGTLVTGVVPQSSQWGVQRRRRPHLCPLRSLRHLWGGKTSMKSLITAWSIKSMTRDNKCFRNIRANGFGRATGKQQAFTGVLRTNMTLLWDTGVGQAGFSSLRRTFKNAGLCDGVHRAETRLLGQSRVSVGLVWC